MEYLEKNTSVPLRLVSEMTCFLGKCHLVLTGLLSILNLLLQQASSSRLYGMYAFWGPSSLDAVWSLKRVTSMLLQM